MAQPSESKATATVAQLCNRPLQQATPRKIQAVQQILAQPGAREHLVKEYASPAVDLCAEQLNALVDAGAAATPAAIAAFIETPKIKHCAEAAAVRGVVREQAARGRGTRVRA